MPHVTSEPTTSRSGVDLRSEAGLTLLEVLIASFILLFVMLAMISSYSAGRINLDREESKRRAVALAQDRLEQVKARYTSNPAAQGAWGRVSAANIDTAYVIDATTFSLVSAVTDSPSAAASVRKTIALNVNWTARKTSGVAVARTVRAMATLARIVPKS